MDRSRKTIKVGIIGLGIVGQGTVEALLKNKKEIQKRTGIEVVIKTIADLLIKKHFHEKWLRGINLISDADWVLDDLEIDIVVELIGGKGAARDIVLRALRKGKRVVTANKALLASFWEEIARAAYEGGTEIKYEAAVGGVIPIIGALEESLIADEIIRIYGVLNGTTNYILTRMEKTGESFESLLREAQEKGYAEANPESDLSGEDAAYKILILTFVSGKQIKFEEINFEGIKRIQPIDFQYAHKLGYTIKLVAVSDSSNGKIDVFVRPMLVSLDNPLATIDGSLNKIVIRGKNSGETVYEGKGAGGLPTGIAVASNIVSLAKDLISEERKMFLPPPELKVLPRLTVEGRNFPWYLRFVVKDRPLILSYLCDSLGKLGININAVHQEPVPKFLKSQLPFVITTEKTSEAKIKKAVERMKRFKFLVELPLVMPFLE